MNDLVLVGGLATSALAVAALASRGRGWRLLLALICLAVIVGGLSLLIEAVAFGVLTLEQGGAALLSTTTMGLAWSVLAVVVTGRFLGKSEPPAPLRITPLRLAGVVAAYIVLYLVAGILAYPHVKTYYADLRLPGLPELLGLQIVRSLLIALALAPLLRLRLRWPELVAGLLLAVVGGIAPLAGSSGGMPEAVRLVHTIEVGISNFLFGVVIAWLLKPGAQEKAPAVAGEGQFSGVSAA